MNNLKSWNDFCNEKKGTPEGCEITAIACPCCGRALYKDVSIVLASYPPTYKYFCKECGWWDMARG